MWRRARESEKKEERRARSLHIPIPLGHFAICQFLLGTSSRSQTLPARARSLHWNKPAEKLPQLL